MKSKKLGKILVILCAFALLCGCENNINNSSENSTDSRTEQSSENSISQDPTNSSDISAEDSDAVSGDFQSTPEPQPVYIGNGMTLTGSLLDESELEEFSIEPYIYDHFEEGEEEFLDSLGNPELKDLYKRARSLSWIITITDNIKLASAAYGNGRNPARIEILMDGENYPRRYEESGYTYESFYNAYLSAFTKETTEELFKEYDYFLDYYGAMLYNYVSGGGHLWSGRIDEVHREYELISKSDTVVEFRRIMFNNDRDFKPGEEYIPELRDEYLIEYIDFKLVLTEDGWRFTYPQKYQPTL